ncbi:hypothetical protein MIT9_P2619 [Methylomarinovum caldicuralii]|uniref:Uncharacterized protein n=1 Tax=Methylomarinovum caldicuralii TaxID=438856 RepID=A0AAU9BVL4_9GAMM|nr:hypothetical protein MIT9_P2619 [Methylomarinovum caldicuralii]
MRGEHPIERALELEYHGSSPHARGTRFLTGHRASRARFIPACAGNTTGGRVAGSTAPVHPRMRGEHCPRTPVQQIVNGSSPHARGTPRPGAGKTLIIRFIPACAGNTIFQPKRSLLPAVHPRMRGEHFLTGARVRDPVRFIPACAGNTPYGCRRGTCQPVHPRMRGEHVHTQTNEVLPSGSSPHARGTRCQVHHHTHEARFIPACAGNTVHDHSAAGQGPVHPRMRGEHI